MGSVEGTRDVQVGSFRPVTEAPPTAPKACQAPTWVSQAARVRAADGSDIKTPDDDVVKEHVKTWCQGTHLQFQRTRFIPGASVAQVTRILSNLNHWSDDQFHKAVDAPNPFPAKVGAQFDMKHGNWPLTPVFGFSTVRGLVTRWETRPDATFQTLLELKVKGVATPDHEQAVSVKAGENGVYVTWRVTTKMIPINYPDVVRKVMRKWVSWQMAKAIERKVNLLEGRIEREETHTPLHSAIGRWFQNHVRPWFSYQPLKLLDSGPGELS